MNTTFSSRPKRAATARTWFILLMLAALALFFFAFRRLPLSKVALNKELWTAAAQGDTESARRLVERGADPGADPPADAMNGMQPCPVLISAQFEHFQTMAALVEMGAPVNKRFDDGSTLLLKTLLAQLGGSFGGGISSKPMTPAEIKQARKNELERQREALLFLRKKRPEMLAAVKSLLAHGANVNVGDKEGITPLSVAIQADAMRLPQSKPDSPFVKLLLENGARIRTGWKQPQSATSDQRMFKDPPLLAACLGNNPETVRLLLRHGADVSAQGDEGRIALRAASGQHNSVIVALLKKAGAKP